MDRRCQCSQRRWRQRTFGRRVRDGGSRFLHGHLFRQGHCLLRLLAETFAFLARAGSFFLLLACLPFRVPCLLPGEFKSGFRFLEKGPRCSCFCLRVFRCIFCLAGRHDLRPLVCLRCRFHFEDAWCGLVCAPHVVRFTGCGDAVEGGASLGGFKPKSYHCGDCSRSSLAALACPGPVALNATSPSRLMTCSGAAARGGHCRSVGSG